MAHLKCKNGFLTIEPLTPMKRQTSAPSLMEPHHELETAAEARAEKEAIAADVKGLAFSEPKPEVTLIEVTDMTQLLPRNIFFLTSFNFLAYRMNFANTVPGLLENDKLRSN
eukprot:s242_g23.t1